MVEPRVASRPAPSGTPFGPEPVASVIIAARDRCRELAEALDTVERQRLSSGAFEVIAVDDGSSDGTEAMLAARAARNDAEGGRPLVTLRSAVSIGPGAARNLAARRARAPILVFLDSDCAAHDGWLEALLAPLGDPEVGAVGGAEALDPGEPLLGRVFHHVLTSALTTGGLRGRSGATIGRYRPRTYSMAVRREAFERVGGFPPLRNGEDIDLSLRIERLGLRLVFTPHSRVYHRRRPTVGGFLRQAFAMGRARSTLIRRDRGHLEPAYFLPALLLTGGVAAAAAALAWPAARPLALAGAAAAAAFLALVALSAALALRHPAAALLAPLSFLIQQLGYGAGFLFGTAFPRRDVPAPLR